MSLLKDSPSSSPFARLRFYTTSPYPCAYLPERAARSQVAVPGHLIDAGVYGELVRAGFRRSGLLTYRPSCGACQACVPVRLPVERFAPNRAQRRAVALHAGLEARELPLAFFEEHYALYRRYQIRRHAGGGMDEDSREQYARFLLQSHVDSRLIEFREGDALRMVSVVDVLADGLSAVYTFFDPDVAGASFGTWCILWQAAQCRALGLPHLYLGYWIGATRKMAYKASFRPVEGRIQGVWRELTAAELAR
ncbi:MAG: arginyltransferase [Zoogloeaceae bacterium]|jgi:arginine-tRNA-protein transferase|nr:arginyltransferase [Zoogloeaceae bacterium]